MDQNQQNSAVTRERSAFKREFKTKEAIKEVEQREKLPYINLLKLIKEGQGKDYSDKDVVRF